MSDFKFLEDPLSHKWVIMAPRRLKRPGESSGVEPVCPFCVGHEKINEEVFRIPVHEHAGAGEDWKVRVISNKFPFTKFHEVVIHSPDHHKSFGELSIPQTELIFKAYRNRFLAHQNDGQVVIFNNHGLYGGESLPHPHSQIAVVEKGISIECPMRNEELEGEAKETQYFRLYAPTFSEWPDEVWIAPKKTGTAFGEITDEEINDFSKSMYKLIQIMSTRHGEEFPYNFYIYPGGNWYLRLIPRVKSIGGFELATKININTQDPYDTQRFINEHFDRPDFEKIKNEHMAEYDKAA